jgi:carboxyl-terminal processing protease
VRCSSPDRSSFSGVRLVVAAIVLAAAAASVRAAQDWHAPIVAAFDEAWQTVRDAASVPDDVDWDAVRTELRPKVLAAGTPETARQVIADMLGRLHRSHFSILTTAGDRGPEVVPVSVRAMAQGIIVTDVPAGSTAETAGLHPGDRIVSVDAETLPATLPGDDSDEARAARLRAWRMATAALRGAAGSSAALVVQGAGGVERRLVVPRSDAAGEAVTIGNLPPLHVRTRAVEVRTPGGRHAGVFAFSVWLPAIDGPLASAMEANRDAAGIVIDLRGNPGGLADMIRGVAGYFLSQPALLGRMHVAGADLEMRANPRRSTADGRRVEPYAGPLAILVDELTASASECFTGGLQGIRRARVFGVRTMGQALPAATRTLPDGEVLEYAVGDFVTAAGRRLEGAGVQPDDIVPVTPEDLRQGRDPVLAAALAWIDRAAL